MHIKTLIILRNFSFRLINFVNVSTTLFIQRFLTFFFIFFIKNALFNVFFILRVNVIYIYGSTRDVALYKFKSFCQSLISIPLLISVGLWHWKRL